MLTATAAALLAGATQAAEPGDRQKSDATPHRAEISEQSTQDARGDYVSEWSRAIEDWSQAVEDRSATLTSAAAERLQTGWREVERRWETLQNESGKQFERAQDAFESAFTAFARRWNSATDDEAEAGSS
jgi:hypothetical protein